MAEEVKLADEMTAHIRECKLCYKDSQLFGRRCNALTDPLFFDPLDHVFHRKDHRVPGRRVPCIMIQNTKKSFYIRLPENWGTGRDKATEAEAGALCEFFYDSYEGWYIRSYYHGPRMTATSEASAKYRQCDVGLALNMRSATQAFATAATLDIPKLNPAQ